MIRDRLTSYIRQTGPGSKPVSAAVLALLMIGVLLWGAYPAAADSKSARIEPNAVSQPQLSQAKISAQQGDNSVPLIIVQKSVAPNQASVGQTFTFTINIQNTSAVSVTNVLVSDIFTLNYLTIEQVTSTKGNPAITQKSVTVSIGQLDPGESVQIVILTRVNQDPPYDTQSSNFAVLSFEYQGATYSNQSNSVDFTIKSVVTPTPTNTATPTNTPTPTSTPTGEPKIIVEKSLDIDELRIGQQAIFTIRVTNDGNATATNLVVTDVFPVFITVTKIETTKGTATVGPNSASVFISSLGPTEKARVKIYIIVNQNILVNGQFTNVASVQYNFAGETETVLSNAVTYRVYATAYLPATGYLELDDRQPPQFLGLSLLAGLVLGAVGLLALAFGRIIRAGRLNWLGALLIFTGLVFSLAACVGQSAPVDSDQAFAPVEQAAPASAVEATPVAPAQAGEAAAPAEPDASPGRLPDYPIPTPSVQAAPGDKTPDISPIKRIVIPSLDVDAVVKFVPFDGFSWKIQGLQSEVAWMDRTSWPGLGGNVGLAGHVSLQDGSDGPFRNLPDLKSGELVKVYTDRNVYTFKVREQVEVKEDDFSVIDQTEQTQLTLITCSDWNPGMKVYLSRLVVYSDLVSVEPISSQTTSN